MYDSPYCSVSLFSSPKIRKCPAIIEKLTIINAVQEPIVIQFPTDVKYIITNCGLRDILYNPLVIGLFSGAFLKLVNAMRNPIVPEITKIVPIINSIEPIFSGLKTNIIRTIKPNIFATLVNVFCNLLHPSSS